MKTNGTSGERLVIKSPSPESSEAAQASSSAGTQAVPFERIMEKLEKAPQAVEPALKKKKIFKVGGKKVHLTFNAASSAEKKAEKAVSGKTSEKLMKKTVNGRKFGGAIKEASGWAKAVESKKKVMLSTPGARSAAGGAKLEGTEPKRADIKNLGAGMLKDQGIKLGARGETTRADGTPILRDDDGNARVVNSKDPEKSLLNYLTKEASPKKAEKFTRRRMMENADEKAKPKTVREAFIRKSEEVIEKTPGRLAENVKKRLASDTSFFNRKSSDSKFADAASTGKKTTDVRMGEAKPNASAEKPAASIEKASASAEKPAASTEKGSVSVEKPAASTEKGSVSVEKPAASTEKGSVSVEKPAASTEKASVRAEKSATSIEKASASIEKPAASIEKASINAEKTASSAEKANANAEKPAASAEKSPVVTEKSAGGADLHRKSTKQGQGHTARPAGDGQQRSADRVGEDKPVVEARGGRDGASFSSRVSPGNAAKIGKLSAATAAKAPENAGPVHVLDAHPVDAKLRANNRVAATERLAGILRAKINLIVNNARPELRLTLQPGRLGEINIRLVSIGEQTQVRIQPTNREVGSMLETIAPQLAQQLSKAGVQVQEIFVEYQDLSFHGGKPEGGSSHNEKELPFEAFNRETGEQQEQAEKETRRLAPHDGEIDVVV